MSAVLSNCGWRRERGIVRTSATVSIACARSSAISASSGRVECPIVHRIAGFIASAYKMAEMTVQTNAAAYFVDRHLAEGRGARTAHRTGGRAVTWADVAGAADRWGTVLTGLGVGIQDRVLLVLDDSPAFVAVFWGTVKIGAVAVPVNPLMAADDYEFLLTDSGAKVVVVEER